MPVVDTRFDIKRSPDVVWEALKDISLVAACMPGVELKEQIGPDSFSGTLKARVGAISSSFEGEAHIKDRDDASQSGTIEARGVDRKGGSRASATVDYRVTGSESTSDATVVISADIRLQGALAQFGRSGLLQDISDQLIAEFADTLQRRLSAPTEEDAAEVHAGAVRPFRLLINALWRRIRQLFGRQRSN